MSSSVTPTLDLTRPVKTRGGHAVRIVDTNYKSGVHGAHIVAIHTDDTGDTITCHYGNGMVNRTTEHYRDLMNEPVIQKVLMWRSPHDTNPKVFRWSAASEAVCKAEGYPYKVVDVEVDF